MSLGRRLWRRIVRTLDGPAWREITGGPAKGCELYVNPHESDAFSAFLDGSHESHLHAWLEERRRLVESSTVWDVGAHIGYHALALSRLAGSSGRVVAFEPNPRVRPILEATVRRNGGVPAEIRVTPVALGSETGAGRLRFAESAHGAGSSGAHLEGVEPPLDESAYRSFRTGEVRVMRGDDFAGAHEAEAPDVLKIDVEGAEGDVLAGCSGLLERRGPCVIVEVHTGPAMQEVTRRLSDLDYAIATIAGERKRGRLWLGCAREP